MAADPVLGTLAYPCEMCGAEPGNPCLGDCPGDAYDEFSAQGLSELIGTPPLEDSEAKLMAAVHRLPYGGLIGTRGTGAPDRQDYDREEWMARLAEWMTEYQQMLAVQVDQLQDQARERIALQLEKDVVKAFFGKAQ